MQRRKKVKQNQYNLEREREDQTMIRDLNKFGILKDSLDQMTYEVMNDALDLLICKLDNRA